MNIKYSGRTTCLDHKHGKWKDTVGAGPECIKDIKFFDVQWSNCPVEVEAEIKRMWKDFEMGNNHYFVKWSADMAEEYPIIAEFLKAKGLTSEDTVHINWWW